MSSTSRKSKSVSITLLVFGIFLIGILCAPLLLAAKSPATSLTIVNNSGREISHVYFSSVAQENWGSDQLVNSSIPSGGSFTMGDVTCDGSNIKAIAEDRDGCFTYKAIDCSQATTWTIASTDARDCGN